MACVGRTVVYMSGLLLFVNATVESGADSISRHYLEIVPTAMIFSDCSIRLINTSHFKQFHRTIRVRYVDILCFVRISFLVYTGVGVRKAIKMEVDSAAKKVMASHWFETL